MKYSKAARPVMMGQNGMVSSGHALASLAGVKVLQEGGNAVDAALAAAFVMAVVKPEASGPGGDLFALVFIKKTGKVEALNSSGPAPAKATIDYFHDRGLKSIPQYGPLSIAVPGAVDGWLELHKKYATKDLSRLMVDAIGIARAGLPISQDFAESIEEFSAEYPWVDRCYRQPLGTPKPGKILAQRGLGGVLEKIAQQGRDGFYAGAVAEKICATIKAEGGMLSEEDLRPQVAQWLEPLKSSYRDTLVYEQPPVSQGFMVLEMLNIAEAWPFHEGRMSRADMIHYQVAAKKLAFEDRIRYLDDPKFGDPKIPMLISKEYAAKRRELGGRSSCPAPNGGGQPEQRHDLFMRRRPRWQRDLVHPKCFCALWLARDRRRHRRDYEQPTVQLRPGSVQSELSQTRQTSGAHAQHLHGFQRR